MKLNYNPESGQITGRTVREVNVGPAEVPFEIEVIESAINASKHSVVARIAGNLHVLVTASQKRARVYVLNYAKIDGPSAGLLKRSLGAINHKDVVSAAGRALVAVYESDGLSKTRWNELDIRSGK